MKYALLRNSDDTLLNVSDYPESWAPNLVSHKFGPEFEARFVPVLDEATPEFNVATHHLERHDRLEDGQWKRGFTVVANPPPEAVTTWALIEELRARNLWTQVQTLIASLPDEQKFMAENRLLRAETIRRDHELTLAIIAALQLSEATVDEIFIAAKVRAAQ